MKTDSESLVVMGRVVAPYGVLGWVKVLPDTASKESLMDYKHWHVGDQSAWQRIKLKSGKMHNDVLLAKLEGVNDRDAAFALKGALVAVQRSELPTLSDNEFYWADLIDMTVSNQQGVDFGQVKTLFETGANDVMVVEGDQERLIPFTAQVVIDVDVDKRTILVDWDKDF